MNKKNGTEICLMLMNIIGAFVAFIAAIAPWWSISGWTSPDQSTTITYSLSHISNGDLSISLGEAQPIIQGAFVLLIFGWILGSCGSFITIRKGKSLLGIGGILTILSPIVFAIGFGSKLPLYKSSFGTIYQLNYGFFLPFIAGILFLICAMSWKLPTEVKAVASSRIDGNSACMHSVVDLLS